jgi:2-haloacid dehalogenase
MPGHRAVDTVVFDLGGVLIDWDPRYLYRKLFAGDEPGMERFLAEVTTSAWNLSLDAGKPFGEAVAELIATHPHERARIEAYQDRWIEMISGPIPGTVALLEGLAARGVPLYAITNWAVETFALVRHDPAYAFLDLFRQIFVSGELKLIKPEPAIFRHALQHDRPRGARVPVHRRQREERRRGGSTRVRDAPLRRPRRLAADLRARGLLRRPALEPDAAGAAGRGARPGPPARGRGRRRRLPRPRLAAAPGGRSGVAGPHGTGRGRPRPLGRAARPRRIGGGRLRRDGLPARPGPAVADGGESQGGAGPPGRGRGIRGATLDRFTRTLGLARAAEASLTALRPEAVRLLEAYARGVNGFPRLERPAAAARVPDLAPPPAGAVAAGG